MLSSEVPILFCSWLPSWYVLLCLFWCTFVCLFSLFIRTQTCSIKRNKVMTSLNLKIIQTHSQWRIRTLTWEVWSWWGVQFGLQHSESHCTQWNETCSSSLPFSQWWYIETHVNKHTVYMLTSLCTSQAYTWPYHSALLFWKYEFLLLTMHY